jgi:hypothetical protein
MDKIKIDGDELLMAMESYLNEGHFYIDKQTGEIHLVRDSSYMEESDEEILEKIENDPARYVMVDPIPSSVGFNIMCDFIDELKDINIKEYLANQINKKHPFRKFKDGLLNYPHIRDKWFIYHEQRLRELAIEWLEENDINAELLFPAK